MRLIGQRLQALLEVLCLSLAIQPKAQNLLNTAIFVDTPRDLIALSANLYVFTLL